jgi:hypothetical protein
MNLKPGVIYQDCAYHPVLCTKVAGDSVEGISLIDGTSPRACSIRNCGIRIISLRTAIQIKKNGPTTEKKAHLAALEKQGWKFDKWWD